MIAVEDWFAVMIPQVEKLLRRPGVRTIVVYETEVGPLADIYGFITADADRPTPVVFYVFVKESYRGAGHVRALFREIGIDPGRRFFYACKTEVLTQVKRKIPFAKFNPDLSRYSKSDPYLKRSTR
jgi:hypothetical protein